MGIAREIAHARTSRRLTWWGLAVVAMVAVGTGLGIGRGSATTDKPVARPARRAASAGDEPELHLTDGTITLVLRLGEDRPAGWWVIGANAFTLRSATLERLSLRTVGQTMREESYRLRFDLDACERETSARLWSGCFGDAERIEHHELLIDRVTLELDSGRHDQVSAACVPVSGAGPTCSLTAQSFQPRPSGG